MLAFLLFAPPVLFVIGALLTLPRSERWIGPIPAWLVRAPAALGLITAFLLTLATPAQASLPAWIPGKVDTAFAMGVDRVNLPFVWVIAFVAMSAVLVIPFSSSVSDRRSLTEMYALASVSLGFVLAANAVTWVATWISLDLVLFWTWIRAEKTESLAWHPQRGLALNMLGGFALLAAGVAIQGKDHGLAVATGESVKWVPFLLILAAAIRLGLYPLHWGLPLLWRASSRVRSLLYLFPVIGGAYLAARTVPLVQSDFARSSIWVVGGALGLLVAGWLARAARSRGELLAWLGLQQACLLVIAAGLQVPQRGVIILLQGLNLPLTVGLLAILEPMDAPAARRRLRLLIRGLKWFAAGSLLGLPPTLGFTMRWALYRNLLEERWWWIVFLSVLGTGLALPALARLLDRPTESEWQPGAIAAATTLSLPLIVLSLQPLLLADFAVAVGGGASADYLSTILRATGPLVGFMIVLALCLPVLGYWLVGGSEDQALATRSRLLEILELEWLSAWIHDVVRRLSAVVLHLLTPISSERFLAWAVLLALVTGLLLLT